MVERTGRLLLPFLLLFFFRFSTECVRGIWLYFSSARVRCMWMSRSARARGERDSPSISFVYHMFGYSACVRACSQLDAKTTVSFCVLFSSQSLHILWAWVRVFLYDLISLCCQISLSVYIFYIVECFAIQRQTEFNSIEFGLVHQYILYCVRR